MTKKKSMTLETVNKTVLALGKSIEKLSKNMDKRFEQVDRRFEQVDRRFEQVDRRFEQVDRRFDRVDKRLAETDRTVRGIDKRVDQLFSKVNDMDEYLFEQVATKAELNDIKNEVLTGFDQQNKRFDKFEAEQQANTSAIRRLEKHTGILPKNTSGAVVDASI